MVNFLVCMLFNFVQNSVFEFRLMNIVRDTFGFHMDTFGFYLDLFFVLWPVFDLTPDGSFSAYFDHTHCTDFVHVLDTDIFFNIATLLPLNGGTDGIGSTTLFPID